MIVKVGQWIDYSSSTTVSGFSSLTTKIVRYMRIADIVFVQYDIQGTSNASQLTFTVPIAPDTNNVTPMQSSQVTNLGTISSLPGSVFSISSLGVVVVSRTYSGVNFNTTLGKAAIGEFWYRVAPETP